jgi:hypothetical protein
VAQTAVLIGVNLYLTERYLKKQTKKGKNESKFGVYSCKFVLNLKKQIQFAARLNWRKVLYES